MEMTEEQFRKQNPQLTPEVIKAYRENWKRIFDITKQIDNYINQYIILKSLKETAENLKDFKKIAEIDLEIDKIRDKCCVLSNKENRLLIAVGCNSQYNFKLN